MRIHDAKLDLTRDLWRKPALARAYLQARLRSPPRSNVVEVLTVSDELGAAVATGLPFAWAPGVAERVLKGELTCERFSRHAEVEPAGSWWAVDVRIFSAGASAPFPLLSAARPGDRYVPPRSALRVPAVCG